MGTNFIRSVLVLTILLGLVSMIAVGATYGLPSGLAVFAGAAWGTVNLYLIKLLIENLASQNAKSYWNIALLFGIKFPLLYLVGFGLFKVGYLPTLSLLLGFSLFFLSIILRGFWAWIFGTKQVVDGHRE
jgi:hypothetical protein